MQVPEPPAATSNPFKATAKAGNSETGWKRSNALGRAGTVISVIGCCCCIATLLLILAFGVSADANRPDGAIGDRQLAELLGKLHDGFTFLAQGFLFLVGGLVGATMSVVGLAVCLADLSRSPNRLALIGVAAGLAGPALLTLMLIIVF